MAAVRTDQLSGGIVTVVAALDFNLTGAVNAVSCVTMFVTLSVATGHEALRPLWTFLWAAGGSFALEIISLYNEIKAERATGLPNYYKNPVFWVVRLLVTGIAGALAVAEDATTPLIAVNIGASAPAILQLLTKPSPS